MKRKYYLLEESCCKSKSRNVLESYIRKIVMQEMAGDKEGGDITTVQDLDKWLKKGSNPRYKNALYFVTEDGAPMSFQAVVQTKNLVRNAIQNDNNDEGFKVVSAAVNYENPRLYCDFTAERIPCLHCGKNK